MNRECLVDAALLATVLVPGAAGAQGIVGGAENGAATGRRAAGPVGGVVGVVSVGRSAAL